MNDLLIHDKTGRLLKSYIAKPSHAVLIVGPEGSGKLSVARYLAETLLNIENGQIHKYAFFKKIGPIDNKAIGIDEIRNLERFLSLKVPNNKSINRAVIIQDSDSMTHEAQNALLKLLEEPPLGTLLILTASNGQSLLPTIRSRVQLIQLNRPAEAEITEFFLTKNFEESKIKQSYAISGGLPGTMSSMLTNEEHRLRLATEWTRTLLSQTTYDRLLVVDELAKQRELAVDITFILKRMSHISLKTAEGKGSVKWQGILKASYEAGEGLSSNANAKLTLTKLMLSL